MGKRGRNQKKDKRESKRRAHDEYMEADDMDDEIDAFHKQRDVVPLNVHAGLGESDDDDDEHPVLDIEDEDGDDDDEVEDKDAEDEAVMDESNLTGLAAKIVRQQKYLQARSGGVEDDMHEEEDEEEEKKAVWGRSKRQYYDADEAESSDEDLPAEEEKEVLRLQREKAKSLSMEDFGFEDIGQDESDREQTLEKIKARGEGKKNAMVSEVSGSDTFEEVKDINALSHEEQMDVVYSSAPELVGLLPELNNAIEELESRVNPLLSKFKDRHNVTKEGYHYLEIKQILLLSYCQAITFYLLLKSEGQPIRDHPVIARLVEIKSLLDKMKELDDHLPFQLEDILSKERLDETVAKLAKQSTMLPSVAPMNDHDAASMDFREVQVDQTSKTDSDYNENKREKQSHQQSQQLGVDSIKMMKVRAALEEKLRQKSIQTSNSSKREKNLKLAKPINRKLETYDDFGDDTMERTNGHSLQSGKLSNLVGSNQNRPKVVSGDDDLPKRDDVGERRRKHELRVLARAGVESGDDAADENGIPGAEGDTDSDASGTGESDNEFYEQVKQQRAAKLAAKADIYSRSSTMLSLPETVDGKRQISYQMEKNRGLTRARKKLTKNPRKKYRTKHEKAVVRRKGQVREIRKATGPYGGEASGINKGISRSIRF